MPGSSSPRSVAPPRQGWTLIELLLSVVIALLVVTLLFSAYHTVITATSGQASRLREADATRAINQLSRELQAAFQPEEDTNCVMRLPEGDGIDLTWCATLLGARQNDMRWFDVTHIRYRTITNGADVVLIREARPLVGPDALLPPVTNQLVHGIRDIRIELYDGKTWQSSWPHTDPPELPRAARIELRTDAGELSTETFIPTGSVITPRPAP